MSELSLSLTFVTADPTPSRRPTRSREIAVLEAVDRIAASGALGAGERLPALLAFLVREEMAGRGERLKGYVIATEALGRPADFDPQDDGIARAEMTRLRKALDAYNAGPGRFDPLSIAIPKGGYRPVVRENPTLAPEPAAATTTRQTSGWRAIAAVAALLAACAVLFAAFRTPEPAGAASQSPVVIVAPVREPVQGLPPGVAFGPGLQSEVAARLSRQAPLRVVLGDAPRDERAFGVAARYRLDIALATAGDALTATAILSRWPGRDVVWSRAFGPARIAAITPEIVSLLADAIARDVGLPRGAISRAEITANDDDAAEALFRCVLSARTYWRTYAPEQRSDALACASRLAPLHADAAAMLALFAIEDARRGPATARDAALAAARREAERAGATSILPLTAQLALASCQTDADAVRRHADALLALAPRDADVIADVGSKLGLAAGDWERALALEAEAHALNPASDPWYPLATVVRHIMTGRHDLARAALGQTPQRGFVTGALLLTALGGASGDRTLAAQGRTGLSRHGIETLERAEALLDGQCWSDAVKSALKPHLRSAFADMG
jgi:hypothetical protein